MKKYFVMSIKEGNEDALWELEHYYRRKYNYDIATEKLKKYKKYV
jgi:hypothetical protein